MKKIIPRHREEYAHEAAEIFCSSKCSVALTGAGISVGSGISDFRSPGGVWTIFAPEEYATLSVFVNNPKKAWQLYRELGKGLLGRKPNPAHMALAEFEEKKLLQTVITQNVDNLHQLAGSKNVIEIHGDHQHLQCIQCDFLEPVRQVHYEMKNIPLCPKCTFPLKPNVVLFGEEVRSLDVIDQCISNCDLLLVIGTSAQIYPAASLPGIVKNNGGTIMEFNLEPALPAGYGEFFFEGDLGKTLPLFRRAVNTMLS